MIDRTVLALMMLALICGTHYAAFEMGKREMCIKDKNYLWSFDYSRCVKVGKENIRE